MGVLSQKLITAVLKRFVKNFDDSMVKSSLWNGVVELTDVNLNMEAIREVLSGVLPYCIELAHASVDNLRIVIPWSHLRSNAIEVEVGNVVCAAEWHCPDSLHSYKFYMQQQKWAVAQAAAAAKAKEKAEKDVLDPCKENLFVKIAEGIVAKVKSAKVILVRCGETCGTITLTGIESGPEMRKLPLMKKDGQKAAVNFQDARRLSVQKKRMTTSRIVKVEEVHAEICSVNLIIHNIQMVLETSVVSNGKLVLPWILSVGVWFFVETVNLHGDDDGCVGRILALVDELLDAEILRAEAPKEVAAVENMMSLDDFLQAAPDVGESSDSKAEDEFDQPGVVMEGAALADALAEVDAELEAEELGEGLDFTPASFSVVEEDDTSLEREEWKAVRQSDKFERMGTHVGNCVALKFDAVQLKLPSAVLTIPDVAVTIQGSRPLTAPESLGYIKLFGSLSSQAEKMNVGSMSAGPVHLQVGDEPTLWFEPNARPTSLDVRAPIRPSRITVPDKDRKSQSFESTGDKDGKSKSFESTGSRESEKVLPSGGYPASEKAAEEKDRKSISFHSNSSHSTVAPGVESPLLLTWEALPPATPDGQEMIALALDVYHVRVNTSGILKLVSTGEAIMKAKADFVCARPLPAGAPVPFLLRVWDAVISEESPSFDVAKECRFPTMTKVQHVEVSTIGPSLPAAVCTVLPSIIHRHGSFSETGKKDEDDTINPEYRSFWERFANIRAAR